MPKSGGEGIRTPDRDSPMPVFKTGAFNRSATPPVEKPFYRLLRSDEQHSLPETNHRRSGFPCPPGILVVE